MKQPKMLTLVASALPVLILPGILAAPSLPAKELQLDRRLNNGVGKTPAMGWNNYNAGLGATASSALSAANAFINLGLDKLGY